MNATLQPINFEAFIAKRQKKKLAIEKRNKSGSLLSRQEPIRLIFPMFYMGHDGRLFLGPPDLTDEQVEALKDKKAKK